MFSFFALTNQNHRQDAHASFVSSGRVHSVAVVGDDVAIPRPTRNSNMARMLSAPHIPSQYRNMRMALTFAVLQHHFDAARILLQNGADPNLECRDDCGIVLPPLQIACWERDVRMARLLLEFGADVNKAVFNRTALTVAIDVRSRELVELLIEFKIRLGDGSGDWKNCPLHFACKFASRSGLAEVLLSHGCMPLENDEDDEGKDALTYSLENHQLKLSIMLIKAGAKVKEKHLAIFNRVASIAQTEALAGINEHQKKYLMDSLQNWKCVKSLKHLAAVATKKHLLHSNNWDSIIDEIQFANIPETLKQLLLLRD
ncbi:putative ankyrin repeat protein [Trichinella nelsoni]|uniref:Putative ankyrin repeat protein n=1 Tax=Trichinella nelsoni TaxID=6336 RepID=A0A0V0RZC9_9BILA|nr:putative ankyrin repeat protein [Trichinella nelsoni]